MQHVISTRRREGDEGGFTLVELLIVMVVIGILAAIAIPTFLRQRENAWRSTMKSDLRNSATAANSWAINNGRSTFTALTTAAVQQSLNGPLSAGVAVQVAAAGPSGFCLEATYDLMPGQPLYFDSLAGVASSADCSSTPY